MRDFVKKHKKPLMIIGLVLLAAALVWAAAELSGQANSLAQDAGDNSADMEMVTLNTIKKPQKTKSSPKPPPCDWKKERQIKNSLDSNDAKYKSLRAKAKSELKSTGKVSSGTKNAVMKSASEFKNLCDQYAKMWDACNCKTRAKTARASGNSRMKSAAVLVGGDIDDRTLADMQSAQEAMQQARREYVQTAVDGGELSDEDKGDIRVTVIPQIRSLMSNTQSLLTGVTSLFTNIQKEAGGAAMDSLTKLATGDAGGAANAAASRLLNPVKALLAVAKSMLSGVKALLADAQALVAGQMPAGVADVTSDMAKKMGGPCFIMSTEEE